jgi:hypothetical protein
MCTRKTAKGNGEKIRREECGIEATESESPKQMICKEGACNRYDASKQKAIPPPYDDFILKMGAISYAETLVTT